MKLFFILILVLSANAFADWQLPRFNRNDNSFGGLRTVWSCPSRNRGDMPAEREVEIVYDESGRASFRPDVFRVSANPFRALKNLFGGRRTSQDVGECLKTFLTSFPQAVRNYQQTQCNGSDTPVCTKAAEAISTDAGRAIRDSSFYRKYHADLSAASDLLPQVATPVPETRPDPENIPETTTAPTIPTATTVRPTQSFQATPRPPQDDARARARLLDYLVDNYSQVDDVQEFTRHCPQLGDTPGQNAGYCRQRFNSNQRFLNNLSQMFTSIRGEPIGIRKVLQSVECLPPNGSDFRDVEDLLHSLDSKEDCDPLPEVGDYKLFRKAPGGTQAWYTSGNYLLKKTGADAYEATVNLDFKSAGGTSTPEQMMSHVRTCLASASPYLKGPNGAKISIKALTPQETADQLPASERPFPGQINILPEGTEINSGNFHSKIDCATVTHEVLHHLGLCDEYKETRTNLVSGMSRSRAEEWSCRVVPNRPSIMKNHVEAFNAAIPQQYRCNCVSESCRTLFSGQDARSANLRKTLMTISPNSVLTFAASKYCSDPVYLSSTENVPDPDKAFVDVRHSPGTLTFQHRLVFMNGHRLTYARKNVTCNCPAGDAECSSYLARAAEIMPTNPPADSCPHYTTDGGRSVAPEGAQGAIDANGFSVVTTPRAESLISPNQFDKILTGACMTSPSSLFKRCSEFAYSAEGTSTCAEKPAECSNDDRFLGVGAQ